jgi:hypothetical protein
LLVLRLLVLRLLVLRFRLCLGARLPVKAQAGRELVALAALALRVCQIFCLLHFPFCMPLRRNVPVIIALERTRQIARVAIKITHVTPDTYI